MAISKITSDAIDATGFNLDSNTLTIDATNNRVGIGTASPSEALEVNGNIKFGDGHFIGDGSGDNLEIVSSSGENIIYKAAGGIHAFYDSGSNERMRIDASGNVGIGVTDPASYYSENLVVKAPAEGGITIRSNATTDTNYLMFADGTSGTQAYRGYLSYTHNSPEYFNVISYGYMRFFTGDPAAERLRILSGGGLTFNGDTATANALDDYEEGTWTPEVKRNDGTVAASIGVGAGSSTYVKIGRLVTIKAWINSIANGSADGSSYWRVNGLPYAAVPYTPAAKGYGSIAADGYYVGDAAGNIILTLNSAPYTGSLSGTLMIGITYETDS